MIKFFRNIRQNMIKDDRISKYLLYAIGEIILVVVGILIAISLNNRNQHRNLEIERNEKITKLRQLVHNDSLMLAFTINYNSENIPVLDSLINDLDESMSFETYKHYIRRFARANMRYRTTLPDVSVYNELINSGNYSNIEQTELKDKMTNYYTLFNHFNDLLDNFVNALNVKEKELFYEGILNHYYLQPNLSSEDIMKGYDDFKRTLDDPTKRKILHNHLFELKKMHQQIIYLYSTVLQSLEGIPIRPDQQ